MNAFHRASMRLAKPVSTFARPHLDRGVMPSLPSASTVSVQRNWLEQLAYQVSYFLMAGSVQGDVDIILMMAMAGNL